MKVLRCAFTCVTRAEISATCTSGVPVSPGLVAYPLMSIARAVGADRSTPDEKCIGAPEKN
jgi:hypothetical protein